MDYKELREVVRNHPKYPGCVRIDRAPLINAGFPGTFNLSFTECPWLKEYGRFVNFDHDYIFSTVQSCIRPEDIPETATNQFWKYLGVFEIADLTGIINLKEKPDYPKLQRWQIKSLVSFLNDLGFPKDRIHPSYHVGGQVREITEGKYTFDYQIPADTISREAFLEAGIPERNLIPDATRDTLLCLHVHRPTGWGYRNEVNVNIGSRDRPLLLDVATLEYFMWKPIFLGDENSSKNIVGIEECKDGMSLCAIGLERLCMAIKELPRVQDVDYIKPFYDAMKRTTDEESVLVGESLRALHRTYSDIASYNIQPSRHHKERLRKILHNIPKSTIAKNLKEVLGIHSETQPWHPNLRQGIEPTIERVESWLI